MITFKDIYKKDILNLLRYFILPIIALLYFTCNDFTDPNPALQAGIIPVGKVSFNSAELYWGEYDGDDFSRYEIYFTKTYIKDFKLYSTINSQKQIFTIVFGLDPDTYYTFFIRIINKNGLYSDSKEYQVKTLSDQPGTPIVYKIEDVSYSSVNLIFSGYKESSAVKFNKYEIYCSTYPGFMPSPASLFDSIKNIKDTTRVVNNLRELTNYYFKIRTYNVLGKFSETDVITHQTLNKPPDTSFVYQPVDITETSALITWTKSKDNDFSYYYLYYDTRPNFPASIYYYPAKKIYLSNQENTSCKIIGLTKNQEYFVKIVTTDKKGESSISNEADFCARPGGGPVPVSFIPEDIIARSTTINLIWTRPTTSIFGFYELHRSTTPNFTPNSWETSVWGDTISATTNHLVTNLKRNTTYYFKMIIGTKSGRTSISDEIAVTTRP